MRPGNGESLRVLIVGGFAEGSLESSYQRALGGLGHQVSSWNMPQAIGNTARLGAAGRLINRFWPAEPWTMKANRNLLMTVLETRPDLVLVCGSVHVLAGTLGQIKAALPHCRTALIWPDSLLYCYSWTLNALGAYDLIATYSQSTVEPFLRLGAREAVWIPLGFDPALHPLHPDAGQRPSEFSGCDASLIGNYTPERERIVLRLVADGFRVKVWGSMDWERFSTDRKALKEYWQGKPLFGRDFSLAVQSAPVNLNPINPVTFPAANMRFFEIPGCCGVSVSARSPEFEPEFPDRQACYYYDSDADVGAVVRRVLDDPAGRESVSRNGHELVLRSHTYSHRVRRLLAVLGAGDDQSETPGAWEQRMSTS